MENFYNPDKIEANRKDVLNNWPSNLSWDYHNNGGAICGLMYISETLSIPLIVGHNWDRKKAEISSSIGISKKALQMIVKSNTRTLLGTKRRAKKVKKTVERIFEKNPILEINNIDNQQPDVYKVA